MPSHISSCVPYGTPSALLNQVRLVCTNLLLRLCAVLHTGCAGQSLVVGPNLQLVVMVWLAPVAHEKGDLDAGATHLHVGPLRVGHHLRGKAGALVQQLFTPM